MRGRSASLMASQQVRMSLSVQRASPQMTAPLTARAMDCTAAKSPGLLAGKPASMTSTPRRASWWAISSFSVALRLLPGDCSPSRSVVSKKTTGTPALRRTGDVLVDMVLPPCACFDDSGMACRMAPASRVSPPSGGAEGGGWRERGRDRRGRGVTPSGMRATAAVPMRQRRGRVGEGCGSALHAGSLPVAARFEMKQRPPGPRRAAQSGRLRHAGLPRAVRRGAACSSDSCGSRPRRFERC